MAQVGPYMHKKSINEKRRCICNVFSHWRILWSAMEERAFRIESKNWRNVLCLIKISTVFKFNTVASDDLLTYGATCNSYCLTGKISDSHAPQHHAKKIKALFCWTFGSRIHRSSMYSPNNVTVKQKAFMSHDVSMCLTAFTPTRL